jgi:protein-tyrosine-phosphatase
LRWRLLQELVLSDRAVRELTVLVDEPQNLVSYHLKQLRDGGIVSARRSAADRRDTYYAIDLSACQDQMQAAGGALHPALWLVPATPTARKPRRQPRILFLCTGNSARSQIAEALTEYLSDGAVRAESAGSNPKALHPAAVAAMRRRGVDISGNRTKHLDEFTSQRFDVVVTLCDRVREVCPEFPSPARPVHWSIPDPALEAPPGCANTKAFERTAAELETRIHFFLRQLPATARRSAHANR